MSALNLINAKFLIPSKNSQTRQLLNNFRLYKKCHFLRKMFSVSKSDSSVLRFNHFYSYLRTIIQQKGYIYHDSKKYQSTFQQEMSLRKKQADSSVLVELSNKKDIPLVILSCEQCGCITKAFSYSGESKNVYLLLEYEDNSSVQNLLSKCRFPNISDAIPTTSRIIHFSKKFHREACSSFSFEICEETSNKVASKGVKSVSQLIQDLYESERLSELNIRLRFFFCSLLKDSLLGIFPHSDVIPFGSSVNGVGKEGCDLDIMIREYPAKMVEQSEFSFLNRTCVGNSRELQKKSVYVLSEFIGTFIPGVYSMKKIIHARVPIMKFTHKILRMECDISVNNMSAVLMSEILFFCGEVDPRVRPLIYAVKKWAREANVTYDAPGSWLTNFALTLLAVHFLQNRPEPVLPTLNQAISIQGAENTSYFAIEYLTPLADLQAKASLNKESLASLLLEFLAFLGSHPFKERHVSVLSGQMTPMSTGHPIWVQYPLEEDLNVTKNVAAAELREACEKARLSASHLASHLGGGGRGPGPAPQQLSAALGLPALAKLFSHRGARKLDVTSLLNQDDYRRRTKRKTF